MIKTNITLIFLALLGVMTASANAGVDFFATRAAFDMAAPGLPIEDFEGLSGTASPGGVDLFADVLDSTTTAGPFAPGDVLPGISFTTLELANTPESLVLLNPAFGGAPVPSNILGPATFSDELVMNFGPGVDAVGFDMFAFANGPGTAEASFFNGTDLIGSVTVTGGATAGFAGGIATGGDVITQVVLDMQVGPNLGELVDNVAFGEVVPEPSSISLFIVALLGLVTRRRAK